MRLISGIQPSGNIHLGNYFGAIKHHIELQQQHECMYFIADYHALTTQHDRQIIARRSLEIAMTYLTLGLDSDRAILYRQSDVPEVTELAWILNCVTPVGLMQRAPAFKEKVEAGLSANMGLFSYPILMAADILMCRATHVPVGQDQLPHIAIAQDLAQAFNSAFKTTTLIYPHPLLTPSKRVVGTDGRKMSKSYKNTIDVFAPEDVLKKQIGRIVTDSREPGVPGKFGSDNASAILDLFLSVDDRAKFQKLLEVDGVGYGFLKQEILVRHQELFRQAYESFKKLQEHPMLVESILRQGAERMRDVVRPIMADVRDAVGLSIRTNA